MPSSSILGRDGLYYRIPDFDEFDGSNDFNMQAYNRKMVGDLQLSDLDPSIRLLQPDTAMIRRSDEEDGYGLSPVADMGSRISPGMAGARLMTRTGSIPMTDNSDVGRDVLQARVPMSNWPSAAVLDSDGRDATSRAFSATPNVTTRNSGLLSRFGVVTPQANRFDFIHSDDVPEGISGDALLSKANGEDYLDSLSPAHSMKDVLSKEIDTDNERSPYLQRAADRWQGMPVLTREEVEAGVNAPVQIDDLLGNLQDIRVAPRTYTIGLDDNPSLIGKRFFGDARAGKAILEANGLPSTVEGARRLRVGNVLTIPDHLTRANLRAGGQLIAADTLERQQAAELAQRQRAEESNSQTSFGNSTAQPSKSELVSSFNGIKEGIKDVGRKLKEKHGDDIFSKGFDQNSIYITTYADINKNNPELGWTGLAPFASNEVRAALAWLAKRSVRNRGESVEGKYLLSATPDRGLDRSSMPGMAFDSLANGNQAVFEDLTPYLRFYQKHGAAKLLSIAKSIDMHEDLQTAFKTLQASQETKDPERAEILRAISAKQMLLHEQRNVLQKMYDEPITSGGAWLNGATGSRILPLDVHVGKKDQPGYFEISPTDKSIDLSNFDDRWAYAGKGLDQFTARYNNPATRDITRQQIHQMADPRNLYQIPPELQLYLKR